MIIDNQTHRLPKWYPLFDFFIFFGLKLSSITDLYGIEDEFLYIRNFFTNNFNDYFIININLEKY